MFIPRYQVIERCRNECPVPLMCRCLKVSPGAVTHAASAYPVLLSAR